MRTLPVPGDSVPRLFPKSRGELLTRHNCFVYDFRGEAVGLRLDCSLTTETNSEWMQSAYLRME
jgi:hypothetical protein